MLHCSKAGGGRQPEQPIEDDPRTSKPRAKAAAETVQQTAAQATQTVETLVKGAHEATQKGYEQALALTKENLTKANDQLFKGYDDMTKTGKENVDAFVQASTVFARAVEDMSKAVFAYTQASVDMSVSTGKALLTAKSLREVVDLQNEFARTSFDSLLAEATKLSELSVKAANQALEPIQARVNATVATFAKPIAA